MGSPLKGSELMKACLAIEPDLNLALDMVIRITVERKFRETSKMTFRSLEELDKHIQSLGLKDPVAFRERILPNFPPLPPHSAVSEGYQLKRWQQRLLSLLCCSSVCRSTPPTGQK
jgi:hypothetical protein